MCDGGGGGVEKHFHLLNVCDNGLIFGRNKAKMFFFLNEVQHYLRCDRSDYDLSKSNKSQLKDKIIFI